MNKHKVLIIDGIDNFNNSSCGIFHLVNSGYVSWYGMVCKIYDFGKKYYNFNCLNILPIPSSDYPFIAQRPLNSKLSCKRLEENFGFTLRHWELALQEFINKKNKNNENN